MDLSHAVELQRAGLAAWMRVTAERSPGAAVLEGAGVTAGICPAAPDRSVVNSVVYRDVAGLATMLERLASAYERAGVHAWTVWVPDHDREAIALLEGAGHAFDGEPAAMQLSLDELREPPGRPLDWDAAACGEELGRVNDLAYGHGGFADALGTGPARPPARFYRARTGGDVACVLETIDVGSDCMVFYVATLEAHRGRGLARGLMHAALGEARDRGLETSTLQATRMGVGVYERLGYRTACRLHMYERRK